MSIQVPKETIGRKIVDFILILIAIVSISVIIWSCFTQDPFQEAPKEEPKKIVVVYVTNNYQECKHAND